MKLCKLTWNFGGVPFRVRKLNTTLCIQLHSLTFKFLSEYTDIT